MAQIFLSCSHDDPGSALQLAKDLKDLAHVVWLDRDLAGGQAWWDQFLARIRASDLFVFVLRFVALSSTACQWEYGYVVELQGPILPVLVLDGRSLNVLPPAPSRALKSLPVGVPLPDALAAPPEVPLFYLATLSQQLS